MQLKNYDNNFQAQEVNKNNAESNKEKTKQTENKNDTQNDEPVNIQPVLPPVPGKVLVKQYDPKQGMLQNNKQFDIQGDSGGNGNI